MSKKKSVKQDLNMTEHASRLRAIPASHWNSIKRWLLLLMTGALLAALGWLAITR